MGRKLKGTVENKGDGKYLLRVTVGYNANGNPKRTSKTIEAADDDEARFELYAWIKELQKKGFVIPEKITFASFFRNQWQNEARANLEQRGFEDYQDIIELRFLDSLGNIPLKDIKPYQIKNIIVKGKNLRNGEKLHYKTKRRHLSAITHLFTIAKDDYKLIDENPAAQIKIPRDKNAITNVQPPYNLEEIDLLMSSLARAPIRSQAIIMTAFVSGSREGEVAALEEKHFDFQERQLTFNQRIVVSREKGLIRLDGLKASDYKTMPVPDDYLKLMWEFMQENIRDREALGIDPKHKYIFGSFDGKPPRPESLYQHWKRFCERNGLRHIRFHDLRHTAASYLISKPDISVKAVQERLGHKDYRTTMNIYAHSITESDKQASDAFSGMLTTSDR